MTAHVNFFQQTFLYFVSFFAILICNQYFCSSTARGLRNCVSKSSTVRNGMSKILRNQSDQNRLSIQKMLQNGSESKFARIIRVMKHCEIGKLQAASIVVLSPAFLAAFHVRTFFGISNFSEFRTFRNSESDFRNSMNSSVWHRSVYQIPIPNPISEFHRPLFIATCINKSQSRN